MQLIRIDRARRRRLRLLLYAGLLVVVGALLVGRWYLSRPTAALADTEWYRTDYENDPNVQLLQRYTRIDTSPDTGSELAGAEFLAAELEAAGISAHIERLGESGANLWAVLEGDDPRALVLHNHIDVYPAGPHEEWVVPPFSGEIVKPWLYGRGVFDMKSVAVAQLEAMRALSERGRPRRTVVFLATGSEEVGSELGTRWVLARYPELGERFWAVLTEGGVVEPVTREEIKYWGVEFAQRRYVEGAACSESRENLEDLRTKILEWANVVPRWGVVPEAEAFLGAYGRSRTRQDWQEILAETWGALHDPAAFHILPDYLKSIFRSEVVPFEPEPDPEGGYRMRLLIHLLPGDDVDTVRDRLLPEWMTHGVTLTLGPPLGADGGSPLDHPLYEALVELVRESYPDTLVGPYFQPWSATDARFFRASGIPAYGFSPFVIFNTDTFRVDGPNERIGLPGFVRGVELYRQVVERIAG